MWYKLALNVINTRSLATQIGQVVNNLLANPTSKQIKNIYSTLNNNSNQLDMMMSQFKIQSLLERLLPYVRKTMDEINNIIEESGEFKNPPKFYINPHYDPQSLGAYDPENNILLFDLGLFFRGEDITNTIAHELTHAKQNEYDSKGFQKDLIRFFNNKERDDNNFLKKENVGPNDYLTPDQQKKMYENYYRPYINTQAERQAHLHQIIGDLPTENIPTGYSEFTNFLDQSQTWKDIKDKLHPENKNTMIKALYKYYHG